MKNILIIATALLISCTSKSLNSKDSYTLSEDSCIVEFKVNSETNIYCECIRHFEDSIGEYITLYRNIPRENYDEIAFYNIKNGLEERSIKVYKEGPNAILGPLLSYDIISRDSIVVTSIYLPIYYLINQQGEIINQITIDKNHGATATLMLSSTNQPFACKNNIIDFPQYIPSTRSCLRPNPKDFKFSDFPIAYLINTCTGEVEKSLVSYPHLYNNDDRIYHNEGFTRVFDGLNYVYSYNTYDSLIVTQDYKYSQRFIAKSKYVTNITNKGFPVGATNNEVMKQNCLASYGNIIYDKYRNCYYRFCYFENEYDGPITEEFILSWGKFTIIILDSDFQIVGETIFPEGRYASRIFFVNKDGLWLSENNYQREDMTDDVLVFRCLKLEDKNKY